MKLAWVLSICALALSACEGEGGSEGAGGSDSKVGEYDKYLEEALPRAVRDSNNGSKFSDVSCIRRNATKFRCIGMWEPSRAFLKEQCGPSCTPADVDLFAEQEDPQATLEVIVDPENGYFVYKFR